MFKKLLSLVLSIVMCATIAVSFSSCGGTKGAGDDFDQDVTLTWAIMSEHFGHADDDLVWEEFNEQLEKLLPHTKVKFISLDTDNWSRWMAAKKEIDIAWSGYGYDMNKEATKQKTYTPLNDLVEKYGENIKKEQEIWKTDYASATIDGELYAIPNQQPWLKETKYITVPASLWEYLDTDALVNALRSNRHTTEEVYQILTKFLDTVSANGAIKGEGLTGYTANIISTIAGRGYEFVDSSGVTYYDPFADEVEIKSWQSSEESALASKYLKLWYEKGYFNPDQNASSGSNQNALGITEQGMWFDSFLNEDAEKGIRKETDSFGQVKSYGIMLNSRDQMWSGVTKIGSTSSYEVIPITSPNPERAMALLNILRANTEESNKLLDLLIYGFQGDADTDEITAAEEHKHYYINEDGNAKGYDYTNQPSASSTYGIPIWVVSNSYYPTSPEYYLSGQKEYGYGYIEAQNNEFKKTPVCGLVIDNTKITSQLTNIDSVNQKYWSNYKLGDQFDAKQEEFTKALKTAGINEVIKEMQKQCDDYVASKK